jgi:dTDP-4-dehydrorhamnose reductase
MKILLTGANGQLGRALQVALKHHQVIALARDQLDITKLDEVRAAVQHHLPSLVLNAAAFNDVDGAETECDAAYKVNALGPRNLAVATAARGVPLLHVSTDYVFDGTSRRAYHEYDQPHPLSVYAASKLAGEEAVKTHNPRHYLVRTAWLYHTVGRNFPKTIHALAKHPEVQVVSDQYGSPTYAPHLAAAIARLIETDAYGTYHLAGRGEASWFELAQTLYGKLGIQTLVRPVSTVAFPRTAVRPRYTVLTTVQTPEILLPPWEEGLAAFAVTLQSSAAQ